MTGPITTRYIVSGIVKKGDSILVGKKAAGKGAVYEDAWHIPGGGVEDQDKAAELFSRTDYDNLYLHTELRREIKEETGLEVTNVRCIIPDYIKEPLEDTTTKKGEPIHMVFLEYRCDYSRGDLQAEDDLAELRWVPIRDLSSYKLTPPSVKVFTEMGWLTYKNPDGSVTSPLDYLQVWPLIGNVAWQVAGPLIILAIGGALLDRRLHTGPICLLLGVIASVAVSYVLVRGTVRRLQRQLENRVRRS